MAAILALVGLVMLPVIHFSVVWWHSLHQGETLLAKGGPKLAAVYLAPLLSMIGGYLLLFGALWLSRSGTEVPGGGRSRRSRRREPDRPDDVGPLRRYVVAAYGISAFGLTTLTVWTLVRAAYWKRRADRATARRRPR